MPRRPRVYLDGVLLHIVQRGHNREPCFFAGQDYRAYLDQPCQNSSRRREQPSRPLSVELHTTDNALSDGITTGFFIPSRRGRANKIIRSIPTTHMDNGSRRYVLHEPLR